MTDVARLVARGHWDLVATRRLDAAAVRRCDRQRVLAPLADAAEDGVVELSDDGAAELCARRQRRAMSAVMLDARLMATAAALVSAGVEIRLLKGAAVSRLDYPRPEHRPYGDFDLLVRGTEIANAVEVLADHGYARHYAEPFPGHDESVGKGVTVKGPAGVEVDLHRTLALGYYGTRLPVATLWDDGDPVDVEGTAMTALSRQNRFLHAALHGSLSPTRRLTDSLDLVRIWSSGTDGLTVDSVVDRAEAWGCAGRVAIAVRSAEMDLPGSLDAELVEWSRNRRRRLGEWIVDHAYEGRLAHSRARTVSAVFGLSGWRNRLSVTIAEVRRGGTGA